MRRDELTEPLRGAEIEALARLPSLLNKTYVRRFALDYAQNTRAHRFERVSGRFVERAEFALMRWIKDEVKRHPSRGKTLM